MRLRASWATGLLRYGLWLALPLALIWGLRGTDLPALGRAVRALSAGEIVILLGVNLIVVLALSGRWWSLLRGAGHRVPYLSLSAYRLAAFAVSYFTPGTHFGGEPLQVVLVQRRHGVGLPEATASVVLDKAIEMLANFGFLAIGLATVVSLGLAPPGINLPLLAGSSALLLIPGAYLIGVLHGNRPAAGLGLHIGLQPDRPGWPGRLARWLHSTESEVSAAAGRAPAGMLMAAGFSVLSWLLLLVEWRLAMEFLEIRLSLGQTVAVVTAARLALFAPLPGAAGVLEAALLFALGRLGFGPAEAIGLALVIRARDLAFGGAGLWLGGWLAGGGAQSAETRSSRAERDVG